MWWQKPQINQSWSIQTPTKLPCTWVQETSKATIQRFWLSPEAGEPPPVSSNHSTIVSVLFYFRYLAGFFYLANSEGSSSSLYYFYIDLPQPQSFAICLSICLSFYRSETFSVFIALLIVTFDIMALNQDWVPECATCTQVPSLRSPFTLGLMLCCHCSEILNF